LSQKQELAVCRPAPFFCMMMQLTADKTGASAEPPESGSAKTRDAAAVGGARGAPMYLKGFCSPVSFFIDPSMMSDVHCGTDWCAYTAFCARSSGSAVAWDFRGAAAQAGGAAGAGVWGCGARRASPRPPPAPPA